MEKLNAEKVEKAMQGAVERVNEIGAGNLVGLLVVTNDEDKIVTDMCGSASSIEEMLASLVSGLCEYEAYAEYGTELATEIICSTIKIGVLRKLGKNNG